MVGRWRLLINKTVVYEGVCLVDLVDAMWDHWPKGVFSAWVGVEQFAYGVVMRCWERELYAPYRTADELHGGMVRLGWISLPSAVAKHRAPALVRQRPAKPLRVANG